MSHFVVKLVSLCMGLIPYAFTMKKHLLYQSSLVILTFGNFRYAKTVGNMPFQLVAIQL